MPSADTDMPYLSMEYLRGETDTPSFVPVSQNLLRAESGDLLLLWDGSNAGEFLRAKQGVVSSTVALIEPRNVDREFLFFACKARERQLKDQTVGMGIPHVSGDELRDFLIPCPPLPEQTAIAEFLDRETGKIDELVAEQRRLMELLKEKRQAVISHAVTRGLNPAAPLKPSGIEWLGDVPAHWDVKRTKHVVIKNAGIQMGPFGGMLLDLEREDTGFKVYGQENTISGDFTRGGRWISEDRFGELANYHVAIGDLLLTRKGSLGNARLVLELPQPGIADSDTIRVRVDERLILPTFLALLFHEADYIAQQINLAKRGAILAGLNSETIANITIVLPSIAQQKEVMAHLDIELAKFDTLTAEAQRAIALLQERRTALISAAVTGQIDVRQLAEKKAA